MLIAYRPPLTLLPERQAWIGLAPSPLLSARHHCPCQSSKRRHLYTCRAAVQPPGEAEGEEPEQIDIMRLLGRCSLLLCARPYAGIVHSADTYQIDCFPPSKVLSVTGCVPCVIQYMKDVFPFVA